MIWKPCREFRITMSSSNRILYIETDIWTPQSLYRLCLGLFRISSKFADTQIKVPHAWDCVHTIGTKPVFTQTLLTARSSRLDASMISLRGEKAISRSQFLRTATNVRFAHQCVQACEVSMETAFSAVRRHRHRKAHQTKKKRVSLKRYDTQSWPIPQSGYVP